MPGPRPAADLRLADRRRAWLYALTQGLHTNVGLVAIPFLLAKLWSVIPRLFALPPVRRARRRRSSGCRSRCWSSSAVFEFATGVMNAQYWYPFKFNFVVAHYYGAVVFVASLVLHVIVKLPVIARAYRERGVLKPLRDDLAAHAPGAARRARRPGDAADPAAPTISRRGLFALRRRRARWLLLVANVGAVDRRPAAASWRSSRRAGSDRSGGDFPVNKTAARGAASRRAMTGAGYRLELRAGGARGLRSTATSCWRCRSARARLPIACVEGWTTTQEWTGVPLAALAERAGAPGATEVLVRVAAAGRRAAQARLAGAARSPPTTRCWR